MSLPRAGAIELNVGEGNSLEILALFNVGIDGGEVTIDLRLLVVVLPLPVEDGWQGLGASIEASGAKNIGLASGRHSATNNNELELESCKLISAGVLN